jgi:hypothetical protein
MHLLLPLALLVSLSATYPVYTSRGSTDSTLYEDFEPNDSRVDIALYRGENIPSRFPFSEKAFVPELIKRSPEPEMGKGNPSWNVEGSGPWSNID